MTTRDMLEVQGSGRKYPDYSQRERELERKLEVFERHLARLLTERVKYCPSCDRHYEPVEGVRS